ncbi:MAG: nickel-dependent lactate racemase [Clostridiales bacterium]|nr:nickel-dependent lactate racemase [Clostridiales bacterium]
MSSVNDLLTDVRLPLMARIRQNFPDVRLRDPVASLREQFLDPAVRTLVCPGMSIAITAGSRGIDVYVPLLCELIRLLKKAGAQPFIIPAMGSHGRASAEGQQAILSAYGITEETVGAPIRSSMEVVKVDTSCSGEPVWVDRCAWEADGIVLFNRIKPHTGFRGDYESGLVKMAAIGLGKQKGAETVHAGGPTQMGSRVKEFGVRAIQASNVLFGVATVEDFYDRICDIRLLTKKEILAEEPMLLEKAKTLMPSIPFKDLDVLIVDRIGKNISGPGMDPNITHTYLPGAPIPQVLRDQRARQVVVLDLTDETRGAAMGIGMADITTKRLFEKMDLEATYYNCITSGAWHSGKIPMMFDNDRLAIQAAVHLSAGNKGDHLRMVRIQDTLHLGEIWVSQALLTEAVSSPRIQMIEDLQPYSFDADGNLREWQ